MNPTASHNIVTGYPPPAMGGNSGATSSPTASAQPTASGQSEPDRKAAASTSTSEGNSKHILPTHDRRKWHDLIKNAYSRPMPFDERDLNELRVGKVNALSLNIEFNEEEGYQRLCKLSGQKTLNIHALREYGKDSAIMYAMEWLSAMQVDEQEKVQIFQNKGEFFLLSINYIFHFLFNPRNTLAQRLIKANVLPEFIIRNKVISILVSEKIDDPKKIIYLKILYNNAFGKEGEGEAKAAAEAETKAAAEAETKAASEPEQNRLKKFPIPIDKSYPRVGGYHDSYERHFVMKSEYLKPSLPSYMEITSTQFLSFEKVQPWSLNVDPPDETGRKMCAGMLHLDVRGYVRQTFNQDSAIAYAMEWLYEMKIDEKERVEIIRNKGGFFLLSIEYIFKFLCDPRNTPEERLVKARLLPHFQLKQKVITILASTKIGDAQKIACLRILFGNALGKEEEVKAVKAESQPEVNAAAAAAAATATPMPPPTIKLSLSMDKGRHGHKSKR